MEPPTQLNNVLSQPLVATRILFYYSLYLGPYLAFDLKLACLFSLPRSKSFLAFTLSFQPLQLAPYHSFSKVQSLFFVYYEPSQQIFPHLVSCYLLVLPLSSTNLFIFDSILSSLTTHPAQLHSFYACGCFLIPQHSTPQSKAGLTSILNPFNFNGMHQSHSTTKETCHFIHLVLIQWASSTSKFNLSLLIDD